MNDIINREVNKCRSEIIISLLQKHHLRNVRGRILLQVMNSVLDEFDTIVEQIENIELEPLRRKLRNEYNIRRRGVKREGLPTTGAEYVAGELPHLIEAEVLKILGREKRDEAADEKSRPTTYQ